MKFKFLVTMAVTRFVLSICSCSSLDLNKTVPVGSSQTENIFCGKIFAEKSFILTSPKYPNNYPTNQECYLLLKGPNCSTYYSFQFLDFDLEYSVGCVKDRLEVADQDALCSPQTKSKNYLAEFGLLQLKFVSDASGSGRGFKIKVQRSECDETDFRNSDSSNEYSTTEVQYEWTSPSSYTLAPTTSSNLDYCCATNYYNSKSFLLVSPGFPYSINSPKDCVFVVTKASSDICRIRIHVLFFWLGEPTSNSCPYAFVEIDGKFICGCNSDLKLTTTFDETNRKVIRFRSEGYKVNSYSGFVIEVIQDECPKRYEPSGENSVKSSGKFRFYNDQSNRISWPYFRNEDIERLQLINETHSIQNNVDNRLGLDQPGVFQHVYIFAPVEESIPIIPKEVEVTNYIETSNINTLLTNLYDYGNCLQWNQLQFNFLNARHGRNLLQSCEVSQGVSKREKNNHFGKNSCVSLNGVKGYFHSPNYPKSYPRNLNICYRINKVPDHCEVAIHFLDFSLEKSHNCVKDYVIVHNNFFRYCGTYLRNTVSKIDTTNKDYIQINFVTDNQYCGKGFYATFKQIPCQNDDITTTSQAPIETTTQPLFAACEEIIQVKRFTILGSEDHEKCIYTIKRYSEEVCKIQLYFELFDVSCTKENLFIGETPYCGNRTGSVVSIDVPKEVLISYTRFYNSVKEDQLGKFILKGTQLTKCSYPEVPAERFTKTRGQIAKVYPEK